MLNTLSDQETQKIWQQACAQLQLQLSPAVYNTWILSNPVTEVSFSDDASAVATITSQSAFHATNLKKSLHDHLRAALEKITHRQVEINYTVDNFSQGVQKAKPFGRQAIELSRSGQNNTGSGFQPLNHSMLQNPGQSPRVEDLFSTDTMQSVAVDRTQAIARNIGLRTDFSFNTFAVSTTNEMAHAAATAVSNRPGVAYNPLFLYGGVGVGKTHLMHAIGNNILLNNPNLQMIYCTGEEFTNEIVQAIQTKKAGQFKMRYRNADVLLIDDIQFIAGKNAVQEEFFHTFNALSKQQKQIVLTSDRPPHEITLIEDRLRSRFEAGLMIDIQQPSFELRTAILLVKAAAANLEMPIEFAKTIAAQVESARKIEGIITSIRSEIELKHRLMSPQLIDEILRNEIQDKRPRIKASPTLVIKTVADHFRLKQVAIKGKSRTKSLVEARHIAMFILKNELNLPLAEIGRWFSGRDHTTVLHAVKKIDEELSKNTLIQQDISAIRTTLAAGS
jgi:chromosomal replication initiator protein